jgi:hypothetical protein
MSNSLKLKSLSRTVPMAILLLPATVISLRTSSTHTLVWKEARRPAARGTRMPVPQPILDELAAAPDDCADSTPGQTTKVDAYRVRNGNETLIAIRGLSTCFCTATGNCEFWVYRSRRGKYKIILHDEMVNSFGFLKNRTNGHRDLVLWSHGSAFRSGARLLQFRRKEYEPSCQWEEEYTGHELRAGGWVWDPEPRINSNTCISTTKPS